MAWLLAILLMLFACTAGAAEIVGRVVSVADGDTTTVLDVSRERRIESSPRPLLAASGPARTAGSDPKRTWLVGN